MTHKNYHDETGPFVGGGHNVGAGGVDEFGDLLVMQNYRHMYGLICCSSNFAKRMVQARNRSERANGGCQCCVYAAIHKVKTTFRFSFTDER